MQNWPRSASKSLVAAALLAGCTTLRGTPQKLDYFVALDPEGNPPTVRIEAVWQGAPKNAELAVVTNYGAAKSLELVDGFVAGDAEGKPLKSVMAGPGVLRLDNKKGTVRFAYRLRTDSAAHGLDLTQPGAGEMPQLSNRHFFTLGALAFVRPAHGKPLPLRLRWALPKDWTLAVPWPTGDEGTEVPSAAHLWDNYLAAGRFARASGSDGAFRFDVAWLGDEPIPQEVTDAFAAVFQAANGLFGGPTRPRYLVLVKPVLPAGVDASPKNDSIQFNVARDGKPSSLAGLKGRERLLGTLQTLAHEYAHTWGVAGPEADDGIGQEAEAGGDLRWVKEGFTEYLARRILLRAGLQTQDEFVAGLLALQDEAASLDGYGKISLKEASRGFFDSPARQRLSYAGGALVALELDLAARAGGKGGLEDFLRGWLPSKAGRSAKDLDAFVKAWRGFAGKQEAENLRARVSEPFVSRLEQALKTAGVAVKDGKVETSYDAMVELRLPGPTVALTGPRAGSQGLKTGDLIQRVAGRAVKTPEDFYKGIAGGPTMVEVKRRGWTVPLTLSAERRKVRTVTVPPESPFAVLAK